MERPRTIRRAPGRLPLQLIDPSDGLGQHQQACGWHSVVCLLYLGIGPTTASLLVAMRDCGGGKVPSRTVLTPHKLGELDSRAGPALGRTPVRNFAETSSARLVLTLNSVRSNKRCLLPWSAARLAPALTFGRRGLSRGIGVSLNRILDALPDSCIFSRLLPFAHYMSGVD